MVRNVLLMHVLLAATIPVCASENWPQFRGPGARGVARNRDVPHCWSAIDNVRWKTEIAGRGWSSPIVWGNHVFLTTVVGEDDSNPPKGKVEGGEAFSEHRQQSAADRLWKVLCLDLLSGKVNWERLVRRGPPPAPTHVKNSYATETPVTDGDRVYACFGNVGLFCFDFSGRLVWSRATPPHTMQYDAGTAASPVLDGDRVYLVNDNEEQSYLLALDKRTGQEVWRVDRDEKSNWCTPYVWKHEKRTEIVTSGSGKVRAYDLDGQLLWWLTGMSGITVPTPFSGQGLLYASSGYIRDKQRPVYAIRPGAVGDISLQPDEYDLVIMGPGKVRVEGWTYAPVLEFDPFFPPDATIDDEAREWIDKDVRNSRHYENKVVPLHFGGDDKVARILVMLIRDKPTSYESHMPGAATIRFEIWQYAWKYGGWVKDKRTRVLHRVILPRGDLRQWTWVWDPQLGGIMVEGRGTTIKYDATPLGERKLKGLYPY